MLNKIKDEIFTVLLKNTCSPTFGAKPSNVVFQKKKQGEVIMNINKLLVTYDGEEQEPVKCQSISMSISGDTILLDIVPRKGEEHQAEDTSQAEDTPQAKAVVSSNVSDMFMLKGDDLESLTLLSDFRNKENQGQKTGNEKLEACTIESGTFDIQDLTSVQNAMLDIVEKEKQFIDNGYKVITVNIPRFDYENSSNFKLIESAVLIKHSVVDTVDENKNNAV